MGCLPDGLPAPATPTHTTMPCVLENAIDAARGTQCAEGGAHYGTLLGYCEVEAGGWGHHFAWGVKYTPGGGVRGLTGRAGWLAGGAMAAAGGPDYYMGEANVGQRLRAASVNALVRHRSRARGPWIRRLGRHARQRESQSR
jgi:hypothetical protein